MELRPDLGEYFVKQGWTQSLHLQIPKGVRVMAIKNNPHSISFTTCVVVIDGIIHNLPTFYMGTFEYVGKFENAQNIATQLTEVGVFCRVTPNKSYTSPVNSLDKITPFYTVKQQIKDKNQARGFRY